MTSSSSPSSTTRQKSSKPPLGPTFHRRLKHSRQRPASAARASSAPPSKVCPPSSARSSIPLTPLLEPVLLPGNVLTPSLGAHLLTQEFCYHRTFYREEWKLRAACGIEITRNLMCSWRDHLPERLLPLHQLLAARFRESDYVKIDETPIRCLDPGKGKTTLGQFWVYHHHEHGVLFDWHKSRANTCLGTILIGGKHTGWRSAVIDTFVEQLRRHGRDAFAWFEWVFDQLTRNPAPENLEALLPTHWLKARAAAADQIIEIPAAKERESDSLRQKCKRVCQPLI